MRRLSGAGLADNNNDYTKSLGLQLAVCESQRTLVFPDDLHQLFAARKRWEVLALLFQRPGAGKCTDARCRLEVCREFRVALVVFLFLQLRFRIGLSYRSAHQRIEPPAATAKQKLRECLIENAPGGTWASTHHPLRPPRPSRP